MEMIFLLLLVRIEHNTKKFIIFTFSLINGNEFDFEVKKYIYKPIKWVTRGYADLYLWRSLSI